MQPSDNSQEMSQEHNRLTELSPANQQIKCVSPVTFSQKLYQSHALEIAAAYEQALEANSLEQIKILLDKVLEMDEHT